jgi:TolB protein
MAQNDRIFFISDQRIGVIQPDGSGECCPEFPVPGQAYWQLGIIFPDGRGAILWSQEPPRNPHANFDDPDGPGHAKTHLWLYDFAEGVPHELCLPDQHRVVGELPGSGRLLVSGNLDGKMYLFTCDLDGGQREDLYTGPGYGYGTSLSPDGTRVAFHLTNVADRPGYEIYVVDLARRERVLIASDPEYYHFGPVWSPDSEWVLYQRCAYREDPGHEHADICLSRADGSETRLLTTGGQQWFGTSYGPADHHGGGSNMPAWSPDGKWITFTRLLPGSRTAWVYRPDRPDTDHFNRDYRPDLARGGTEICLIAPFTGEIVALTHDDPPAWNFRTAWSPDANRLVFTRAEVGTEAELWVMDVDGANRRFLTRGIKGRGADHGRWQRLAVAPGW